MIIDFEDIRKYKSIFHLEGEIWVDIKGYEKYYQISDYGRVRSKVRYDSLGRLWKAKILSDADNGNGYRYIPLRVNGKAKNFYVHRLVAEHFIPNPDNLPQVNHKPAGYGKRDNRSEFLEWCTEKENIRDAHENGQMINRTVFNTKTDKKSDEFIEKMYRRYKETGKVGQTARDFGVSRTTLSSIVNKRSRTDVTNRVDMEHQNENPKNSN